MDYADARTAFFADRDGEVRPPTWTTPARRLRDALEPIAAVSFWSEPVYDELAARGLDFLQGYVLGRASVLGKPEPAVVASVFGVFEPGMIGDVYAAARTVGGRKDIRAALARGVSSALEAALGPAPDEVAPTAATLRDAALACPTLGRPLFSAWTATPWPREPWQQLWHAASMLRELRGDGHLAALVGLGLDGAQANVLTEVWVGWEPRSYSASRGWPDDALATAAAELRARGLLGEDGLTPSGIRFREQLERITDLSVAPAVHALGDVLDTLVARVDGWAQCIVDHGWFPPDPYKRAAG